MKYTLFFPFAMIIVSAITCQSAQSQEFNLSAETEECLACHTMIHPGLVESWYQSRHSRVTPAEALKKAPMEKRMSSESMDSSLLEFTVGCYECHALNTDAHADSFEHNGYHINLIVSPNDCSTCHSTEVEQYSHNLMAHAYSNLVDNDLYQDLIKSVNNPHLFHDPHLTIGKADSLTMSESCLYCHGTKVEVISFEIRETELGEYQFPVLTGWPNQGVGRINPDGSFGACTACHTRHEFSIETARKPYTCAECHKGPDVPAYKVYEVSKHGNIFKSKSDTYEFTKVPWTIGEDFLVPTCATCHVSLLVSPDGTIIAERTHRFNDRLSWRLFGVPYAHPHPVNAHLKNITNSDGLPLAVEMDGTPVTGVVIDRQEQETRSARMKKICASCHHTTWIDHHFERLDHTIETSNAATLEATKILMEFWENGFASGLPQGENIFDEAIERSWTSVWLFYANSTRFASAMAGGGDYGVFANGRYQTTEQLYKMMEMLKWYRLTFEK